MNKNIVLDESFIRRSQPLNYNSHKLKTEPQTLCDQNPEHSSHNYLNVELSPKYPDYLQKYRVVNRKVIGREMESMALRRIKQQQKFKRKRLIIEGDDKEEMVRVGNSLLLAKGEVEIESRMKSINSEKKPVLKHGFLVNSPPKKAKFEDKWSTLHEGTKCDLIKAILKKYKEQDGRQNVENLGSPSIASVQLNRRERSEGKPRDWDNAILFCKKQDLPKISVSSINESQEQSRQKQKQKTKQKTKQKIKSKQRQKRALQLVTRWGQFSPWITQDFS